MKNVTILVLIFLQSSFSFGQRLAIQSFSQITKKEFDKHQPIDKTLLKRSTVNKTKNSITIKTVRKTIVLKDDDEFIEYKCLADIVGTKLTLVQKIEPNSEEYYFINRQTGEVDTLVGEPVFALNQQDVACFQGAETDVKQKVQVGQITNGRFHNRGLINLRNNVYPDYIYWFNSNTLYIQDNKKHYWQLLFKWKE